MKSEKFSFFLAVCASHSISRSNLVLFDIENLSLTYILDERFINVLGIAFNAQAIFLVGVEIVIFVVHFYDLL